MSPRSNTAGDFFIRDKFYIIFQVSVRLSRDFNKSCDIKEFCRKKGIGYESFRKLFKNQIGVSPWQYRIRRRLDLACALLRDPEMQINEISLELGYSSAYDFSAQFKKYFKVSPVNYRAGGKIA